MIGLLDPRIWLVALCLMASSYGVGRWHQHKSDANAAAAAELQATQAARAKEAAWSAETSRIRDAKDLELASVGAQLDDALKRLRNRPINRLPATATCSQDGAGSTGAQLSEFDAAFLTRESARADRTAADLRACQAWAAEVTKK